MKPKGEEHKSLFIHRLISFVSMKIFTHIILITLFSFLVFPSATAQNKAASRRAYCEVKGQISDWDSETMRITFDFGTEATYSLWTGLKKNQQLVDEQGQPIEFPSLVATANYLARHGWKFRQAYTSVYEGRCIHHWIFYKNYTDEAEVWTGLLTRSMYEQRQQAEE